MKKILSWLLIAALAIGMIGTATADAVDVLDFEDGNFAFIGASTGRPNADAATALELVDFNGSKALKISAKGIPCAGLNISGLAGDKLADVAAISFTIGVENGEDGKFYAASGYVYSYTGEGKDENKADWSVYMAKKNPRTVTIQLGNLSEGSALLITEEAHAGNSTVAFVLDDIKLLDKDGNAIALDATAQYVSEDTGRDLSNLFALTNAVELPGFQKSAGAWAQDGIEMTQEFLDALVPGSVIEVDYKSEDGAIWVVFPWAAAGWMRVGGCGNGVDAVNNSHNIAQIPYELIEQFCGEDKSTWGAMLQCEGSSNWEVYAVRVGQRVKQIALKNAVELPGFQKSAGAWAQDGVEMTEDFVNALVPGSVVEITYASEDGDIWIVMPWAAAGWIRVSQGSAVKIGGKAYITYEEIEALCGEDKSTWGAMMQCESSSPWEVYSVRVGQKAEFEALTGLVNLEGFSVSGDAWAQDGKEMPQEFVDALVPGSVITFTYECPGNVWIVLPWATAGWSRVGAFGDDAANGKVAQVTYEQIVAVCGEDKSTWGAMLQCEGSDPWTVYSLAVGQAIK